MKTPLDDALNHREQLAYGISEPGVLVRWDEQDLLSSHIDSVSGAATPGLEAVVRHFKERVKMK